MLRETGTAGAPMRLEGRVVGAGCGPLAGMRVDLWQADGNGGYDTQGFRLRGHQLTDAEGRFAFDTVRPGRYPGRTAHFHLRVTPPQGRALTTQLYFPDEGGNARDPIFRPELALALDGGGAEARGTALIVLG
jgi:protocatechuate 3,4-dioxygenase beta subunit